MIHKTLSLDKTEIKFSGDSGVFKGYASVWGGVDTYGDTILPGAFKRTLKKHGMPKMFFQHVHHMPVGKYTVVDEDQKGLWVEGELTPGHSLASDVHAALKHGTLDGLSIGGVLESGDYKESEAGREIKHWSHLMEISPVVFPADRAARIDLSTVKSEHLESLAVCKSVRDFESFLRDVGLDRDNAKAFISGVRAIFAGRDVQEESEAKALAKLQQLEIKLI
jgi:uncharacterized protein